MIDGYQIALIVVTILLLIAGGHIKLLAKEMKELISVIHLALEDGGITKAELEAIVKEAKDVHKVVKGILGLLARKQA